MQKTSYELLISDWRSDVCSSDLSATGQPASNPSPTTPPPTKSAASRSRSTTTANPSATRRSPRSPPPPTSPGASCSPSSARKTCPAATPTPAASRSEEHTSELQSLMRISYAVFCLKKKTTNTQITDKQKYIDAKHHDNHFTT